MSHNISCCIAHFGLAGLAKIAKIEKIAILAKLGKIQISAVQRKFEFGI
jgi:hypothetical protein